MMPIVSKAGGRSRPTPDWCRVSTSRARPIAADASPNVARDYCDPGAPGLVECAWCSLQYNPWARITYERIHGGKRVRRKKAAVALARRILVMAWAMLRDGSDYDPQKLAVAVT